MTARNSEADSRGIYQVLSSIANSKEQNEFVLRNIHVFREFDAANSVCTPALKNSINKLLNPERELKRISTAGLLRRCAHCGKLGTTRFLDTDKTLFICSRCGHIAPRGDDDERVTLKCGAGQAAADGTDRSSFSSAELRLRPKSVYSPYQHMQSWLLRICGVELVFVRDEARARIESHLRMCRVWGHDNLLERERREMCLCSFSWWFKTLKILGLSVYYNCISYFIRTYGPTAVAHTMPVFTVAEQAYILSRFRDARELFSKMKINLFRGSKSRNNFWHYGIFLYHLLLYTFPPERAHEFIWAYPHQLRLGHQVKDVQRRSGKAFAHFFFTLRKDVLDKKPYIKNVA